MQFAAAGPTPVFAGPFGNNRHVVGSDSAAEVRPVGDSNGQRTAPYAATSSAVAAAAAVAPAAYECETCPYRTNLRANFHLHCQTDKHMQRVGEALAARIRDQSTAAAAAAAGVRACAAVEGLTQETGDGRRADTVREAMSTAARRWFDGRPTTVWNEVDRSRGDGVLLLSTNVESDDSDGFSEENDDNGDEDDGEEEANEDDDDLMGRTSGEICLIIIIIILSA